jgi:hypothetical protein
VIVVFVWLETAIRVLVGRVHNDERGQDVLVWLLVIFVLWLIVAGRRIIVQ